jgi:hypothetical protein
MAYSLGALIGRSETLQRIADKYPSAVKVPLEQGLALILIALSFKMPFRRPFSL